MLQLKQTCGACPESYDAFYEGEYIGYLYLRHGTFGAYYNNERVYVAYPRGDGIFELEEREKYLTEGCLALQRAMVERDDEPVYEFI